MATDIRYILVDHKNHPIGEPSKVSCLDTDPVDGLKEKVKEKEQLELPTSRFDVWRCTNRELKLDGEDAVAHIQEAFSKEQVEYLEVQRTIAGLQFKEEEILIIRLSGSVAESQAKRKRDEVDDIEDPAIKRLRTETAQSPLTLALPKVYHGFDTIPIDLLCETFGRFKDRCCAPPSQKAFVFLGELAHVACAWYPSDAERAEALRTVLEKHTGFVFHTETTGCTKYIPDGNTGVDVMAAVTMEVKEDGPALDQTIACYAKFLKQAYDTYGRYEAAFPSILLPQRGSTIGFYGAMWDGRMRVEPLTPIFDLSAHYLDAYARRAIASSLDAFMETVPILQAHYANLKARVEQNSCPPPPRLFEARGYPYLTSYQINGKETLVTFETRLDDKNLVFFVSDGSAEYVVKFTQRYSEKAHRYLASIGAAPKLWQCKELPGGWIAVLMDKSNYTSYSGMSLSNERRERVRHKVTEVVQMLHAHGFVHGDIRDVNLLVDKESLASEGGVKVHFLDFDSAGPIGEARYPYDVNMVSMKRPAGVEGGGIITKQLDLETISYLDGL
ncbi:hypothetical protein VNI00_005387 [Paramarasmius palmivorus]|uniref:Non-specific serine/threonine protein kinase n=1 Tax=Paramarasmius palmivorus TaxID=297713 RepID=A0AAW0DDP2_9AGAR